MAKNIGKSVGSGGVNLYSDVRVVQYLLNCVPVSSGGPQKELAIDGAAGPLTKAAIVGFQKQKLGFCDGRVDPGGRTLTALQIFDPYPMQPMASPPAGKSGAAGTGAAYGKDATGKSPAYPGGGKSDGGGDGSGGKTSGAGASGGVVDTWGYYNPASPYYMTAGYEPGSSGGGKSDSGKSTSNAGGSGKSTSNADGSGKSSSSWDGYGGKSSGGGAGGGSAASTDPWGYYNPASPYYMKSGYAPGAAGGGKSTSFDGGGKSA